MVLIQHLNEICNFGGIQAGEHGVPMRAWTAFCFPIH